jgi:hypothetical protein
VTLRRKRVGGASTGVLMKAALDYARLGWSVIPIEPRGKRPLIRWQVHQYRRAGGAEIGDWFRHWPEANLAVVTGIVSGLVVLDLDPRHGADASLGRLRREHGPLPETVQARTGGGGRHLYFAHPGAIIRNRVGIAPGVDLRGDGGYVVAPPSVHPSGETYRWLRSPDVFPTAPTPGWLMHTAQDDASRRGHSLDHWRALLRQGVDEGQRNNTIASLAGHLLWYGVDPEVATELLLTWNAVRCRPPLDAGEVVRTVASITRLHRRGDEDGA